LGGRGGEKTDGEGGGGRGEWERILGGGGEGGCFVADFANLVIATFAALEQGPTSGENVAGIDITFFTKIANCVFHRDGVRKGTVEAIIPAF